MKSRVSLFIVFISLTLCMWCWLYKWYDEVSAVLLPRNIDSYIYISKIDICIWKEKKIHFRARTFMLFSFLFLILLPFHSLPNKPWKLEFYCTLILVVSFHMDYATIYAHDIKKNTKYVSVKKEGEGMRHICCN